jgi:hypothetical protein
MQRSPDPSNDALGRGARANDARGDRPTPFSGGHTSDARPLVPTDRAAPLAGGRGDFLRRKGALGNLRARRAHEHRPRRSSRECLTEKVRYVATLLSPRGPRSHTLRPPRTCFTSARPNPCARH